MLRLTFLLCSALFLTMLIGGRDYGQMRAGLAAAAITPSEVTADAEAQPIIQPVEVASLDIHANLASTAAEASAIPIVIQGTPIPLPEPAAASVEDTGLVLYVTAVNLNVRSGPSTAYPVVGKLAEGEAALLVGDDEGGWAPIRIEGDGVEGYASAKYLSSVAPY